MTYFLDTNICIYYLKGMFPKLRQRLLSESPENIKIPSIVEAELLYGVEKSQKRDENGEKISRFLFPLEIANFSSKEAHEYAKIRSTLEMKGELIGPNDLIIASIVKANNGILVTHNIKEFQRVEELTLEDWTE